MITTRGFQISNLPRYTAPDPNLLALNPMTIGQGTGQVLQLGQLLQSIQDQRAREDELAATRPSRVAAAIANSNRATTRDVAFTPVEGKEASVRSGQLDQMQTLFPAQTESMLSGLRLSNDKAIADRASLPEETKLRNLQTAADQTTVNPVAAAKKAQAELLAGTFNQDASMLPQMGLLKKDRINDERDKLYFTGEARPLESDLLKMTLNDKIADFDVDKYRKDRVTDATAAKLEAQAALLGQRPDMEAAKSAARAAMVDPHVKTYSVVSQDYARQSAALKNLESTHVVNPFDKNDDKFTAGQLADALDQTTADSPAWKFWNTPGAITENQKKIIADIASQREDVRQTANVLGEIRKQIASPYEQVIPKGAPAVQPKASSSPVYGKDPKTGKIVVISK